MTSISEVRNLYMSLRWWYDGSMELKKMFDQRYQVGGGFRESGVVDLVVEAGEILGGGRVLDLGAGDGRNSLYLAEKGFEVVAVDFAETGIEKILAEAKEYGWAIKGVVSNVLKYEFEGEFDLVIATGLLHFLPPREADELVERMKRHTRVGGLNVVGGLVTEHPRRKLPNILREGKLKRLYSDWEILKYEEVVGRGQGRGGEWRQPPKVGKLLARKS